MKENQSGRKQKKTKIGRKESIKFYLISWDTKPLDLWWRKLNLHRTTDQTKRKCIMKTNKKRNHFLFIRIRQCENLFSEYFFGHLGVVQNKTEKSDMRNRLRERFFLAGSNFSIIILFLIWLSHDGQGVKKCNACFANTCYICSHFLFLRALARIWLELWVLVKHQNAVNSLVS